MADTFHRASSDRSPPFAPPAGALRVEVDGQKVRVALPDGSPLPLVQKLSLSIDAATGLWQAEVHCLADVRLAGLRADGVVYVRDPGGRLVQQYVFPPPSADETGERKDRAAFATEFPPRRPAPPRADDPEGGPVPPQLG